MHIEAHLDFPDEDIDPSTAAGIRADLAGLAAGLDALLVNARQGVVLRDGVDIAIAGPPNAGKSSLLNRLAGYDAAIVTEVPGTTRDTLRERIVLDGLPVNIVDTAGIRTTEDPIEREGVRRARLETGRADRVLWLGDVRDGLPTIAAAARADLGAEIAYTIVVNKIDLELAAEELRGAQAALGELTGEVTSDDLLGEIFASFCIGK